MEKGMKQRKKKIFQRSIIVSILTLLVAGVGYYLFQSETKPKEKVEASRVVTPGDFWLEADNKWDDSSKSNYAELNWEATSNASYRMFQSKDGTNWNSRSIKYNKHLRVLNLYPDAQYVINHTGNRDYAATLKPWIGSLNFKDENGNDYITVDSVRLSDFNADPNKYLTDKYDVLYVGTFNRNGDHDTTQAGAAAIRRFANTGRGVLFGHDVVAAIGTLTNFNSFATELGLMYHARTHNGIDVKVVNNGFMMQYPYELSQNAKLQVPWTHNNQWFNQNISEDATVWLTFEQDNTYNQGNGWRHFYFATNKNYGMIQTADHRADNTIPPGFPVLSVTEDECRILANALYHFAQVTTETSAFDYTVSDEEKPVVDGSLIRCGSTGGINVLIDGRDTGSKYQWYVEASAGGTTKKSDIVEEEIKSNVAGYFYEVSDSANFDLVSKVEGYKNEFGRITPAMLEDPTKNGVLVAPEGNVTEYETKAAFSINESASSEKYVHIVAVDRASNISEVKSLKISDMVQPVDFAIERTADEAKLVDLKLDASISPKMKSVEIQVPKNTEIKEFDSLQLESGWYSFVNSETTEYNSYTIAMETNNSVANIEKLLNSLRFTINSPVDDPGVIKILFHEKVYTSWEDPQGVMHHYVFIPEMPGSDNTWFEAYNGAKKLTYRGLTGYLATITSEEEHDFIFDNIAKEPGWLGGTRGVLQNGEALSDNEKIPEATAGYDTTQDNWYWANGPEAGEVFYIGKRRQDSGYAPPGVYEGFEANEPNNAGTEFVLQFAHKQSKFWNDRPGDDWYGYYVEFSEYGTQKEGEEITDVCWNADIPQKISMKAYDEAGAALSHGDILEDQALRIGKDITIQPKELELYSFIEARETDNTPRDLDYKNTNTYQEGKLIYSIRRADLHIRQVIQNPNDELVVPKEGYLMIQNQLHDTGALDANYQVNTTVSSGKEAEDSDFTAVIVSTSQLTNDNDEVLLSAIIPEFYKYNGYRISDTQAANSSAPLATDAKISLSRLGIYNQGERWITIYMEPNGTNDGKPQPYSWDYKKNDLGKIKTK